MPISQTDTLQVDLSTIRSAPRPGTKCTAKSPPSASANRRVCGRCYWGGWLSWESEMPRTRANAAAKVRSRPRSQSPLLHLLLGAAAQPRRDRGDAAVLHADVGRRLIGLRIGQPHVTQHEIEIHRKTLLPAVGTHGAPHGAVFIVRARHCFRDRGARLFSPTRGWPSRGGNLI